MHPGRPLIRRRDDLSRSSLVVAVGFLLTGVLSACQALLLVFIAGEGPRTDAFLAAYSVYLALTILGLSMRASVVPLLGNTHDTVAFTQRATEVVGRIAVLAAAMIGPLLLLAPVVGRLLTTGLPASARGVGVAALAILAPAAFLQVCAAALSALLGAALRFEASALLYIASAVVGLGVAAAGLATLGVLGTALGLTAAALVLAGGHLAYARRFGLRFPLRARWLRESRQYALAGRLLAGAALPITVQLGLTVSLSAVSGEANAITAYSYAFFAVLLAESVSVMPLGLVMLPGLVERLASGSAGAAAEQLRAAAPLALAVLVPLMAVFAAFAPPMLDALFAGSLSPATVDRVYELGLVLGAMAVPLALMYLVSYVLLALGRSGRLLAICSAGVALEAALVLALASRGVVAVAAGHAAAVTVAACLLLAGAYGRAWAAVAAGALWRAAPAFLLSAIVFGGGRLATGPDPGAATALVAAVVTLGVYAALVAWRWPAVGEPARRLLPRRGRAPGPAAAPSSPGPGPAQPRTTKVRAPTRRP